LLPLSAFFAQITGWDHECASCCKTDAYFRTVCLFFIILLGNQHGHAGLDGEALDAVNVLGRMESEFIAWLRTRLPPSPALRLGPGDDAAILRLGDRAECVVTTDMLNDGIDFRVGRDAPRRIGRKALGANLSDLASMAARPLGVVVAVALPRDGAGELARELLEGMLPMAERYAVAIAGGDTNVWDGPLAISITAIGEVTEQGPLLRSGAQPGDRILVTGAFGGSILGRQFDFEPRVQEALQLNAAFPLHAGTDVSDGLSLDLSHICAESGVGAVIDVEHVPIAPAAYQMTDSQTPLEHALGDGEDFELILSAPPDAAREIVLSQPIGVPVTDIGEFVAGSGLHQRNLDGRVEVLKPRGFEHRMES
jgi:thiamine-monophosphate kinase